MADSFDELLDGAAPALADRGSARDVALAQMVRDARDTVRPAKRPRRRTAVVTAALTGALLLGGGGVAVAAGLVQWPTGFEHPNTSFSFALPSGRQCEVRLVVEGTDAATPAGEDRAQQEVERWLTGLDLWKILDMPAAERESARILQEQRAAGATIRLDQEGWLSDARLATGEPTADDAYAFAVDRAVRAEMRSHLAAVGIPETEWTFSAKGGVKCAAE